MMYFKKITTQELIAHKFLEIGDGYRAKNSEMAATGIPFIRAGDVDRTVRISGTDYLSDASARIVGRKRSLPGDVVITTKGTIGRLAFVHHNSPEFIYSPQICFWRSLNQSVIDSRWLFFTMQSPFMCEQMAWSAAQTDMAPYISLIDQRTAFSLLLPPIEAQRSIASILGLLDDKIDLNRQTNETLEAMARALFRDWFVDFGPTRAKMAGEAPYLAQELWELFPDRLDDEGKPEGWETSTFDHCITILTGGTPKTSVPSYWNGSIPWFSVVDAPTESDVYVLDTTKKITQDGLNNSAASILPENTIIISARGTVGKLALTSGNMTMNQSCYGIRGSNGYGQYFILQTLKNILNELKKHTHGSVFDTITRQTFSTISTTLPSLRIAQHYENMVSKYFERILVSCQESRTLSGLRDLLLPKLMSGEISIRDAEKMVEDAA